LQESLEFMQIDVAQLFLEREEYAVVDVRTLAEYDHGHIPGAINLPLFSNEERAKVGTIYKKKNPEAAMLQGLEYVGPKMADFVRKSKKLIPGRKAIIHCWRGGKRSASMSWLLNFSGFDTKTLEGGYKAYRRHILQAFFNRKLPIILLSGYTGSGKTDILKALQYSGEQVIDLEGLAHHKGSTFGALGQEEQPQVEQFENNLYEVFSKLDFEKRVWVEGESKSIGRVFIPDGFWNQMLEAPMIDLVIPQKVRVNRLVREYADFPKEELEGAFERIQKRLGGQNLKAAREAIKSGDFFEAASIALYYYDKAYERGQSRKNRKKRFEIHIKNDLPVNSAKLLIDFAEESI